MTSYVAVESPNAPRPSDPLVREMADKLHHIERNYLREGSGPGSRFEGKMLEDVQAGAVMRAMARELLKMPIPQRYELLRGLCNA